MTYAPRRVNGQWVELTPEEIAQREAEAAIAQQEYDARLAREAKVAWAIDYLSNQDFRGMITAVNGSAEFSTAQKTLYTRLIKGQAALSLLLREMANDIDITGW